MTPLDWVLAQDWTVPLSGLLLAVTVVIAAWQVRSFHQVEAQTRPDRRIPANERALLGDDWRDRVIGPRTEDFIRRTRTRFAVYTVTGADPESNESRDLAGSGSLTRQGEMTNAPQSQ